MKIAFFVRHFTERGTEVAVYDYAHYNETILGNQSVIVCFTPETQARIQFPSDRHSYAKFKARFPIFEINSIDDMAVLIPREKLDVFYTLVSGAIEPMYKFDDRRIWGSCKTVKHCVFNTTGPESDCYAAISQYLNVKYKTNYPVIPHMISLPPCTETLRAELGIPADAIVLGRHGGIGNFNVPIAHRAIRRFLETDSNVYFLFMNTYRFYEHPRIVHLPCTTDLYAKSKFINTCDAMIHAREDGEVFPLSIGEFCVFNKPIITCPVGDLGHLFNLKDRAILYQTEDELFAILTNLSAYIDPSKDWNAYKQYTPDSVMRIFADVIQTEQRPRQVAGLPPFLRVVADT